MHYIFSIIQFPSDEKKPALILDSISNSKIESNLLPPEMRGRGGSGLLFI